MQVLVPLHAWLALVAIYMTINELFSYVIHIDQHLSWLGQYRVLGYVILSTIVFLETGFIFFAWLPGDSLLFAAGAAAALGHLHVHTMTILLITLAFIGNGINYWCGQLFGGKFIGDFDQPKLSKLTHIVKPHYLSKTKKYFLKYGTQMMLIAPFLPIIRTLTPFLAGMMNMQLKIFMLYNLFGTAFWICFFLYSSYYFGHLEFVRQNIFWLILAIIVLPFLLAMMNYCKNRIFSTRVNSEA